MTKPPPTPLLLALRNGTRQAHHLLDHHPLLAPLPRQELTLDAYGDALAALHGIHQAGEIAIATGLARYGLDYDWQPRQSELEADLVTLGRTPWPLRIAITPCNEIADLIGLLYVIEGSRLGGLVIGRQLATNLPQAPCRFYADNQAPTRWAGFQHFAETRCPSDRHPRAHISAQAAFHDYVRHLDDCLAQGKPV